MKNSKIEISNADFWNLIESTKYALTVFSLYLKKNNDELCLRDKAVIDGAVRIIELYAKNHNISIRKQ